jgi:hypothetical protein
MEAMLRTGLQATALGQAVEEVNRMVRPPLTGGSAGVAARRPPGHAANA